MQINIGLSGRCTATEGDTESQKKDVNWETSKQLKSDQGDRGPMKRPALFRHSFPVQQTQAAVSGAVEPQKAQQRFPGTSRLVRCGPSRCRVECEALVCTSRAEHPIRRNPTLSVLAVPAGNIFSIKNRAQRACISMCAAVRIGTGHTAAHEP